MRGGLGRGASERRAGASGVSPARTKDAAVTEKGETKPAWCARSREAVAQRRAAGRRWGPCPASPGIPSSPALPAAAWSPGRMEEGWLSVAEP